MAMLGARRNMGFDPFDFMFDPMQPRRPQRPMSTMYIDPFAPPTKGGPGAATMTAPAAGGAMPQPEPGVLEKVEAMPAPTTGPGAFSGGIQPPPVSQMPAPQRGPGAFSGGIQLPRAPIVQTGIGERDMQFEEKRNRNRRTRSIF